MDRIKNAELIGILEKQLVFADRLYAAVREAMAQDVPRLGKTSNAAVMVAGLIENYYTCLETAYQKISQHFENQLDPSRWHAELLEKMAYCIEGVRIPAVSEKSQKHLVELQRFRHFKRYYFELEYDWLRLEFVLKQLDEAHPAATADLKRFAEFMRSL
jgi:hypothetical protein